MATSKPPSNLTIKYYNLYGTVIKNALLTDSLDEVKKTLLYLNKEGLDRRDIFSLLRYINLYDEDISEEQSNFNGDILDFLSGWGIIEEYLDFISFSDDPIDRDELAKYMSSIGHDGWSPD